MKASDSIKDFIKSKENLRLKAYYDNKNVITIGYGHTGGIKITDTCTKEQAEAFFDSDCAKFEAQLDKILRGVTLSQNQYDAVFSLFYNIGIARFKESTLLKRIRSNPSDPDIRNQFNRWVYCNGQILGGLVTRREQEANLYFKE
jgi:lysozyme